MELPDALYQQASRLVKDGVFQSQDALVAEAVRRFLETQDYAVQERFIREDVEWGLHGKD